MTFAATLVACGGDSSNGDGDATTSYNYTPLLINVADNFIIPTYTNFQTEVSALKTAVDAYCTVITTDPADANETSAQTTAQNAWKDAIDVWQQAELLILGPLASNKNELRNRILNFSDSNFFDEAGTESSSAGGTVTSATYDEKAFNQRGLLALEYILYNNAADQGLVARQNRCAYGQFITDDLVATIASVISQWDATDGNYRASFIDVTLVSERLPLVSDALFYFDKELKDYRLGIPLNVNEACTSGANCADSVESPYSNHGLENIKNNLLGFKQIFTGGTGIGFDDAYAFYDQTDASDTFISTIDDAIAAIDDVTNLTTAAQAITGTAERAACDNAIASPETASSYPACNLYGYIKRVSDKLRTEFITIIDTNIPTRSAGDTD